MGRGVLEESIRQVNGPWIETDREFRFQYESVVNELRESTSKGIHVTKEKHISICQGLIRNYDILEQVRESSDQWKVVVKVVVMVYDPKNPRPGERRTIAVIPFRNPHESFEIEGTLISSEEINRKLSQATVSQMVQSRKFTVLDREYMAERLGEQELIKAGNSPLTELIKIGKQLGADHLVVGSLERTSVISSEKVVKLTGYRTIMRQGNMEISYRVLDVATGKINWANVVKISLSNEEFDSLMAARPGTLGDDLLIEKASVILAGEIIDAIYPIKVVKVSSNGEIILNQGGIRVQEGEVFEVYVLGKELIDPDTKEYLGREEKLAGVIVISRVLPKMSYANVTEGDANAIPAGAICRAVRSAIR